MRHCALLALAAAVVVASSAHIPATSVDNEDHIGKILQIREAVAELSATPSGKRWRHFDEGESLGEVADEVVDLQEGHPSHTVPDARSEAARSHAKTAAALLELDEQVKRFGTPQSEDEVELGEAMKAPTPVKHVVKKDETLRKLLRHGEEGDDESTVARVSAVVQYLKKKPKATVLAPDDLAAVRQFYVDETAKELKRMHGHSAVIMQRYAESALHDIAKNQLSFEGLSVAEQKAVDPARPAFAKIRTCLEETSRLAQFLEDLEAVKAHPWRSEWSQSDEEKAQTLIRLNDSAREISDGLESLMAKVQRGQPLSGLDAQPSPEQRHEVVDKPPTKEGAQKKDTPLKKKAAEEEKVPKKNPTAAAGSDEGSTPTKVERHEEVKAVGGPEGQTKKKKMIHVEMNKKKREKKMIHVEMKQLRQRINDYIAAQLDRALHMVRHRTVTHSPLTSAQEDAVNAILQRIAARILRSTLSYKEWADAGALGMEAAAVRAGDPERPSRIASKAGKMKPDQVVAHFLHDAMAQGVTTGAVHPAVHKVPSDVVSMMEKGFRVPGGATLMVHVGPRDEDVDLTEPRFP